MSFGVFRCTLKRQINMNLKFHTSEGGFGIDNRHWREKLLSQRFSEEDPKIFQIIRISVYYFAFLAQNQPNVACTTLHKNIPAFRLESTKSIFSAPFPIFWNMSSKNGVGIIVISHDSEAIWINRIAHNESYVWNHFRTGCGGHEPIKKLWTVHELPASQFKSVNLGM